MPDKKYDIMERHGIDPERMVGGTLDTLDEMGQPLPVGRQLAKLFPHGKTTPEALKVYLDTLRETGLKGLSALRAGLSGTSICRVRHNDEEFARLEEEQIELFRNEKIDTPFRELGIDGIMEPIFSHKTGEKLGEKRIIHPQIALAYAKKMDPGYRERDQLEVTHTGGVLLVGAPVQNMADWHQQHANVTVQSKTVDSKPLLEENEKHASNNGDSSDGTDLRGKVHNSEAVR